MSRPPSPHDLLSSPSPVFSSATVQRALIVWTRTGHRNAFPAVCNYYHALEALESTLTLEERTSSQRLEYDLLSTNPPTSPLQQEMFPYLYPEETRALEFNTLEPRRPGNGIQGTSGVSPEEIVKVSEMIKRYCLEHRTTLREFLSDFSQHASKYGINPTVSNVAFFIQYQKVLEEKLAEKQTLSEKRRFNEKAKFEVKSQQTDNFNNFKTTEDVEVTKKAQYGLFNEQNTTASIIEESIQEHNKIETDKILSQEVKHITTALHCDQQAEKVKPDLKFTNLSETKAILKSKQELPIDLIEASNDIIQENKEALVVVEDMLQKTTTAKMTYASVTENKPRTFSSLFDKVNTNEIINTNQVIETEAKVTTENMIQTGESEQLTNENQKMVIGHEIEIPVEKEKSEKMIETEDTYEQENKERKVSSKHVKESEPIQKEKEIAPKIKAKKSKKKKRNQERESDKENNEEQINTSEIVEQKQSNKDNIIKIKLSNETTNQQMTENNESKSSKDSDTANSSKTSRKTKKNKKKKKKSQQLNDDSFHSIKDAVDDRMENSEYVSVHDESLTPNDSKIETYDFDLSRQAIERLRNQIAVFSRELEVELRLKNSERSRSDVSIIVVDESSSNESESSDLLVISSGGLDSSLGNTSNLSEDFEVLNKKRFSTSSQ